MQKDTDHSQPQGLTQAEVRERTDAGRVNIHPRLAGKSTLQILAGNLFTLFNLLNAVLAIALLAVGSYRNMLFLGVVISNTVIGTVQELRAKRTIDKLQLMSAPLVRAVRGGQIVPIASEEIVEDDLFIIGPGDQLCVDAQVVQGQGAMNESLLTGESEPVDKTPGDALLSGSYVTEGTLYARATRVGADSYAAQLLVKAKQIKQPNSELMRSMRLIVRTVGTAILPLGLFQLYKQIMLLGRGTEEAVVSTVAAMLGMIPEGLVLLTSVALAVGVIRLGQRNTLVQDLYAIESLARVDVLCVDKTGTITKGEMEVTGIEPLDGHPLPDVEERISRLIGALTDTNATFTALRARFPAETDVAAEAIVPFSSARKWSAASFADMGTCVIGAPEFILGGRLSPALAEHIEAHARQGERVLLFCHSPSPLDGKALPPELTPQALVLLSDVLREDAPATLDFFAKQDVAVKVISGDNPLTVAKVARMAGLRGAEEAVDATTLDTPEKLCEAAGRYTVFGRVTPDQKKALVEALKAQGHTVGMMGDGVNDIPAMKASDCAVAMAGGSDAAKRVSQLSLLDASFAAMPDIVMEGRRVINNITRAASLFLVKTTFSFLLSLLLVFLPMPYPFVPIQMTLISSMTVGIPSFFLALEPNHARVKGNFLLNVLRNAFPGGIVIVLQILAAMLLSGPMGISQAEVSTIAVWTTGFSAMLVLLLTCLPLNWLRGALVGLMAVGFVGAALLLPQVFYLVPLRGPLVGLALGLMAAAVPLMFLLRRVVGHFMPQAAEDAAEASCPPAQDTRR